MGKTEKKTRKKITQLNWPKYQKPKDKHMGWTKHNWPLVVDKIAIKLNLKISNNLNQSVNTNVDIVIQLLMKCLIQWKLRTLVEVELNDRQRDPYELKFSITKVLMILSQVKKD